MTNKNPQHERLIPPVAEISSVGSTTPREVGGKALVHFEEHNTESTPTTNTSFEHLFPATRIPADLLITEASTAEGAERLLNKLEDNDPYKDYALSQLALYFMEQGELEHAYHLLHRIIEDGRATQVLSRLVMYEEDHNIEAIPLARLGQELRERAVHAYDTAPSAHNAWAIREASEALPQDEELRTYARVAIAEHPEILPIVS